MRTPVQLPRVAIVGSRTFKHLDLVRAALEGLGRVLVVSGGASGVDQEAKRQAELLKLPYKGFPAKWELLGREAGLIRNREIIDYCSAVIILWDGKSPGTAHTLQLARLQKKPLILVLEQDDKIDISLENW